MTVLWSHAQERTQQRVQFSWPPAGSMTSSKCTSIFDVAYLFPHMMIGCREFGQRRSWCWRRHVSIVVLPVNEESVRFCGIPFPEDNLCITSHPLKEEVEQCNAAGGLLSYQWVGVPYLALPTSGVLRHAQHTPHVHKSLTVHHVLNASRRKISAHENDTEFNITQHRRQTYGVHCCLPASRPQRAEQHCSAPPAPGSGDLLSCPCSPTRLAHRQRPSVLSYHEKVFRDTKRSTYGRRENTRDFTVHASLEFAPLVTGGAVQLYNLGIASRDQTIPRTTAVGVCGRLHFVCGAAQTQRKPASIVNRSHPPIVRVLYSSHSAVCMYVPDGVFDEHDESKERVCHVAVDAEGVHVLRQHQDVRLVRLLKVGFHPLSAH